MVRLLCLLVVFVGVCAFVSSTSEADNQGAAEQPVGLDLMVQRRDVLKERWEALNQIRERGVVTDVDAHIDARTDLLGAELELAKTRQQRVALRLAMVNELKMLEESYQVIMKHGAGTAQDVLAVRAERLLAEIELLREEKDD